MGDLFGGPFLCPCSTCLQGHYGGRVMTALMIPAAPPLAAGAATLPGGKRVTGFADPGAPDESSSFATPRSSVGRQKESASEFLVSP